MIGIRINNEYLELPPNYSIRMELINPMFVVEEIVSAYTFPFSLPATPYNSRIFGFLQELNNRMPVNTYDAVISIDGNDWMSGSLLVKFQNGSFSCAFSQKLDLGDDLEALLTELDYGQISYVTDPIEIIDEMKDRALGTYPTKDYVFYPVYDPDALTNQEDLDYTQTGLPHFLTMLPNGFLKYFNYWGNMNGLNHFYIFNSDPAGSQNDFIYSPSYYIPMLVRKIFERSGIEVDSPLFLDDEEIATLTLFTEKGFLSTVFTFNGNPADVAATLRTSTPFSASSFLPEAKMKDLLFYLKKAFCLTFFFDFRSSKVEIVPNRDIIRNAKIVDWTDRTLQNYEIDDNEQSAYGFEYSYSADPLYDSLIRQLEDHNVLSPVATVSLLPVAAIDSVCLVEDKDVYYIVQYDENGDPEWQFFSNNLLNIPVEDGTEVVVEGDTLLQEKDLVDEFYQLFDWSHGEIRYDVPSTRSQLNMHYNFGNPTIVAIEKTDPALRLLFYRGMQPYRYSPSNPGFSYPFASHDVYGTDDSVIASYSLRFDGDYGLKNVWWKDFIAYLSKPHTVTRECLLSPNDILNFDFSEQRKIEETVGFVKKASLTFTGKSVSLAKVELI